MKVGFTGTRKGMTEEQEKMFKELIKKFDIEEFHHGVCIGADGEAHTMVFFKTKAMIHLHPPKNKSKMVELYKDTEEEANRYVWYKPKDYLARNHDIVDAIEILIATPQAEEEILRSGTWATIRYARKKKRPVYLIKPNGSLSIEAVKKKLGKR
jgi:hypothetical protein